MSVRPPPPPPTTPPAVPPDNDDPAVPGFHTWRGVYLFVLGTFAAIVAALTLFTWAYA
jgi:hypothetical protein